MNGNRNCIPTDDIKFPFVTILNKKKDNEMNVMLNENLNALQIYSQKKLEVFGDLEILMKLKYQNVSREFLEKRFLPDIINRLPHKYLKLVYS